MRAESTRRGALRRIGGAAASLALALVLPPVAPAMAVAERPPALPVLDLVPLPPAVAADPLALKREVLEPLLEAITTGLQRVDAAGTLAGKYRAQPDLTGYLYGLSTDFLDRDGATPEAWAAWDEAIALVRRLLRLPPDQLEALAERFEQRGRLRV